MGYQFGGGVMLLINNVLQHDQFIITNLKWVEAASVCLYLQNHGTILFVSSYLPPTATLIYTDLDGIFSKFDSVVLVGDINMFIRTLQCFFVIVLIFSLP